MTRLWILSDLHVDRDAWSPPAVIPEHDAIVVAGDCGSYLSKRVIPWLADTFGTDRPVIYVPGNHCYWKTNLTYEKQKARVAGEALGVTVLMDGETTTVCDTLICGATLWTSYDLPEAFHNVEWTCGQTMADHRYIKHGSAYHRWWTKDAALEHAKHRAAIEAVLATPHDGPTVVVTHHPPHPVMLAQGTWSEPLDGAYASDLSAILESEYAPELWISGHTHVQRDVTVGRTRLVSNARGYILGATMHGKGVRKPENPDFRADLVLDVVRREPAVALTV